MGAADEMVGCGEVGCGGVHGGWELVEWGDGRCIVEGGGCAGLAL